MNFFKKVDLVLGVMDFEKQEVVPEEIIKAHAARLEARKNKDYAESDRLRKWIENEGYIIEDTPQGSKVKKA